MAQFDLQDDQWSGGGDYGMPATGGSPGGDSPMSPTYTQAPNGPAGDWRSVAVSGNTGGYSAGGYQPGANSGISGGMDPSNWGDLFKGGVLPDPTPKPQAFDFNAFRQRGTELGGQYSGSLDDFVNHIFPTLSNEFTGIQRFGSKGDKIRLPNGEVIDAVLSAGLGGRGYNWNPEEPQFMGGAGEMSPVLQDAINKLTGMFSQQNVGLEKFMGIADQRLSQLTDPAVTEQDRALMRTNLQEPIESQRAAQQQRVLERASSRGLGLGSGVIEQQAQGVDQGFDRILGEGFRGLAIDEMNRKEGRGKEAVGIGQLIAQLAQNQQGMQANAAGNLAGIGQYLTTLPMQQMQAATSSMNALDNQHIPQQDGISGLIGLLTGLSGQGENAYNNAMGQDASFWSSLFGQIPGLIGAIGSAAGGSASNTGDAFNTDYPYA